MANATPVPDKRLQQIRALKNLYITHPGIDEVKQALDVLVKYGTAGQEEGNPASCVLVTGDSGSGKTALLHWWSAQFEAKLDGQTDHRPILYVEVPPDCTIKALSEAILRELGIPEDLVAKGTLQTLTVRVKHHLEQQGVKLVILDEVQHLIDRRSHKVIYKVADFVKGLLNAGICPFVLSGTPEARVVYSENTQLKRRTFFRRPILPYQWDKEADQDAFRSLLLTFEENLPFEEPSKLAAKSTALRIHQVSEGLVGRAIDFLVMATMRALEQGAPCLTQDILRQTAGDMWDGDDPEWHNPFDPMQVEQVPPKAKLLSRVTRLRRGDRAPRQSDLLP